MKRNYKMLPLARAEQEKFDASVVCPKCLHAYTKKNNEVRHHDHQTSFLLIVYVTSVTLLCERRKSVSKVKTEKSNVSFIIKNIMMRLTYYVISTRA